MKKSEIDLFLSVGYGLSEIFLLLLPFASIDPAALGILLVINSLSLVASVGTAAVSAGEEDGTTLVQEIFGSKNNKDH